MSEKKRRPGRYPEEFRKRAVRMVLDHQHEYPSQWKAIESIAKKLQVNHETLRQWFRRAETDSGDRPGITTVEIGLHTDMKYMMGTTQPLNEISDRCCDCTFSEGAAHFLKNMAVSAVAVTAEAAIPPAEMAGDGVEGAFRGSFAAILGNNVAYNIGSDKAAVGFFGALGQVGPRATASAYAENWVARLVATASVSSIDQIVAPPVRSGRQPDTSTGSSSVTPGASGEAFFW